MAAAIGMLHAGRHIGADGARSAAQSRGMQSLRSRAAADLRLNAALSMS